MKTNLLQRLLSKTGIPYLKNKYSLILLFAFTSADLLAQNTANVIVQPSSVTRNVGQSFTVTVRVDFTGSTPSADVAEVHLAFDKTKLSVTSVTKEASAIFPNETIPLQSIATINSNGQVNYAAGTPGPPDGPAYPTSDFDLLSITFSVIGGAGSATPLTLLRTLPANNTDVIRSGFSILESPFVTNGTVIIPSSGCAGLPTSTISNTIACEGQGFQLKLASATGGNPGAVNWDLVINGTTYNDITVGSTITTFTPPTETIWTNASIPASASEDETSGVTVGVKFRSSVAGLVKGIRFYNGTNNSGTYRGKLFNSSGGLLQSKDFTSVTTNGWQQVTFTTPVQIAANTTYIAAYYSSGGHYAQDVNYFTTSGHSNGGSLTALQNGIDGVNGVYIISNTADAFPNLGYQESNYWVDVLFTPGAYTFNLTSTNDNDNCSSTGSPNLQTLVVTSSASCGSLPVTLVNFSATPKDNDIILNWSTATEINNKGFEVQRSIDNTTWQTIGFVNGAGNSNSTQNYTYSDNNLFPHRYYYRLKQIDLDEKFTYSMIVSATIAGKAEFSLGQNYPNPFKGETTIQYTLAARIKVNLTLFDMNGRILKVLVNGTQDAGTHAENFYSGQLPPGVYYYKMQAGDFSSVRKLVIQ